MNLLYYVTEIQYYVNQRILKKATLNIVLLFSTDKCSAYEYNFVRYKVKSNSNCKQFCQCAPLTTNTDGSVEYYWQRMDCPSGTLWSDALKICDHDYNVKCGSKSNMFFKQSYHYQPICPSVHPIKLRLN